MHFLFIFRKLLLTTAEMIAVSTQRARKKMYNNELKLKRLLVSIAIIFLINFIYNLIHIIIFKMA